MRFKDFFSNKKKILSFEFFPPKSSEQLPSTFELIKELSFLKPDFMTVTYGAGGGTRALTHKMVDYIQNTLQFPAVAHLTCVGHSKKEVEEVLLSLSESGVSRVLALRGDPPKGADRFVPHPEGFSCARDLSAWIAEKKQFSVAVAGYPETHKEAISAEEDIRYLKSKVDTGAEVVITQLFFDAEMYFSFVDRARSQGINTPIVPGLMPIANVSQVTRFTNMCGASIPATLQKKLIELEHSQEEVVRFGIDYTVDLAEKLLRAGAPGLHLYTLNKSQQVKPIVEKLRERNLF